MKKREKKTGGIKEGEERGTGASLKGDSQGRCYERRCPHVGTIHSIRVAIVLPILLRSLLTWRTRPPLFWVPCS